MPMPSSATATRTARWLAPEAGAASWPTGTIEAGASTDVNLDQAPDQPSGVSGHHSTGSGWGVPNRQIP